MYDIPDFRFKGDPTPVRQRDVLHASKSLDFASLAAGASTSQQIAVDGAEVTDDVTLHPEGTPAAGLAFIAWVSAPGVVTVRATNVTAGVIDAAAFTWRVRVWKS